MPGIEPGPPRLAPRTVRPPYCWRITDQLRPIESEMVRKPGFAPGPSPSQGEMLLLHHVPEMNWSLWSDSHRRIRVYETRPVAAEAQRQLKLALSRGLAPRTSAFAKRRAELITP